MLYCIGSRSQISQSINVNFCFLLLTTNSCSPRSLSPVILQANISKKIILNVCKTRDSSPECIAFGKPFPFTLLRYHPRLTPRLVPAAKSPTRSEAKCPTLFTACLSYLLPAIFAHLSFYQSERSNFTLFYLLFCVSLCVLQPHAAFYHPTHLFWQSCFLGRLENSVCRAEG
jgi:hypothetical protein